MTVKQLAKRVDVSPDIIRYYTRIGLLKPTCRAQNCYRLFSNADVSRLKFIFQAKGLGFTLSEIAQILNHAEKQNSPCPLVRDLIARRIKENRQRLDELGYLQNRMEKALSQWKDMPDGIPNGHSVCHLIEVLEDS